MAKLSFAWVFLGTAGALHPALLATGAIAAGTHCLTGYLTRCATQQQGRPWKQASIPSQAVSFVAGYLGLLGMAWGCAITLGLHPLLGILLGCGLSLGLFTFVFGVLLMFAALTAHPERAVRLLLSCWLRSIGFAAALVLGYVLSGSNGAVVVVLISLVQLALYLMASIGP